MTIYSRVILLMFTVFLSVYSFGQSIYAMEYFLDDDPGFGAGVPLPVASAEEIEVNHTIPLSDVSEGIHTLYVRAKNDSGWSMTNHLIFFVTKPLSKPDIDRLEYFIDDDPGVGEAISLDFELGSNMLDESFVVPLEEVAPGIHTLYIRCRTTQGIWSTVQSTVFLAVASPEIPQIVKMEYFIDNDPGFGAGAPIALSAGGSISIEHVVSLDTLSSGVHNLYVRAQDHFGGWSLTQHAIFSNLRDLTADLTVTGLVVESQIAEPGTSLAATFTINNTGELEVEEEFMMGYYLSSDDAWGDDDQLLSTSNVSDGISTASGVEKSHNVPLPEGMVAGEYYLLVHADYENVVAESDDTNNFSAIAFTVNYSPVVTVNALLTNNTSPALSGTVDDTQATVTVRVNGEQFTATNHGDGTWSLEAGIITPALGDGTHEVEVTATDAAGNAGSDTTTEELIIDTVPATVTVDALETSSDSPALSGTIDDETATVAVTVDGVTYQTEITGATWTLAAGTISSLSVGTYEVTATATDLAGNSSTDNTAEELRILAGAPTAIAATAVDYFSFTANWQARSGVESYQLDVSTDGAFVNMVEGYSALSTTAVAEQVSGLEYGTEYYYRVRAVYLSGDVSPSSDVIEVKTLLDLATVADSLALLSIYEATGGTDWTSSNWTSNLPLGSWEGVTMSSTRVTSLDLSSKNLTGAFPAIASGLERLETLNLSGNELMALPDLSRLTALTSLDVRSNELEFGSLEPNVGISGIVYAPQDSVGTRVEVLTQQGATYVVDKGVSGSANSYRWFKQNINGEGTPTELEGTGAVYALASTAFEDEGNYFARVESNAVPGLELITRPDVVKVSSLERDSTALMALYEELNGSTWTTEAANWPNDPLSEWFGITIENERITALTLPDNNMTGRLNRDILDVAGLRTIDLSDNALNYLPDFSALENLESLDVSGNHLEFDDLEKNMDVAGITYANQALIGALTSDTLRKGETHVVRIATAGANNRYQWLYRKDVSQTKTPVSGATSPDYQIGSVDYDNMGRYTVEVTNTQVPGLTLSSRAQQVWASAELVFVGIGEESIVINEGFGYALKDAGANRPLDSAAVVTPASEVFTFKLVLGDYLIAIEGDKEVYLPTYYRNTDLWEEADFLELREDWRDTLYMAKIPVPLPPLPDGGVVKGFVESDFEDEEVEEGRIQARRKVKKAGCSMRRRTRGGGGRTGQEEDVYKLVAHVETNDEGQFEFGDLPDGFYRFNIQYPGIPMNPDSFVEFEIGANGVEGNEFTLEAYVTEEGIEVIKVNELGFFRKYFKDLSVYPNPADQALTVSYGKLVSENVEVQLLDLSGTVILQQAVQSGYGHSFELDVSKLPDGMYLLNFVDSTSRQSSIIGYKIYVKH